MVMLLGRIKQRREQAQCIRETFVTYKHGFDDGKRSLDLEMVRGTSYGIKPTREYLQGYIAGRRDTP